MMEITKSQYQQLCNIADIPHNDPSINELITAFGMQRINLIACGNITNELRAENARLTAEVEAEQMIPVTQYLPKNNEDVLILDKDGIFYIAYVRDGAMWINADTGDEISNYVISWKSLRPQKQARAARLTPVTDAGSV